MQWKISINYNISPRKFIITSSSSELKKLDTVSIYYLSTIDHRHTTLVVWLTVAAIIEIWGWPASCAYWPLISCSLVLHWANARKTWGQGNITIFLQITCVLVFLPKPRLGTFVYRHASGKCLLQKCYFSILSKSSYWVHTF